MVKYTNIQIHIIHFTLELLLNL